MKVRMIRVPIHILRLRNNILILYLKDWTNSAFDISLQNPSVFS